MSDFMRGLIWLAFMVVLVVPLWARECDRRQLRILPGLIGLVVLGNVMVGIVWLATSL